MKRIIKTLSICLGILFLFVVGCKKKGETTTTNKTNKTTIQTTSKESSTKKTTIKTTTKSTTTEEIKNTLISLANSDDSHKLSFKYMYNGSTKKETESAYIKDDTNITISIEYAYDTVLVVKDGEDVYEKILTRTEYEGFDTFDLVDYAPKTNKVEISYRDVTEWFVNYDRGILGVTLEVNDRSLTYSTYSWERFYEKTEIEAKIINDSGKRVYLEIYSYDSEDNLVFESEKIIDGTSYDIPKFVIESSMLFKVKEYVGYKVNLEIEEISSDVTYEFKATNDDKTKDIVSGNEYFAGSKISISITNPTNTKLYLFIVDEHYSMPAIFKAVIDENSTYTLSGNKCITLDKAMYIHLEPYIAHSLTLNNNPTGVTYEVWDSEDNHYQIGDFVKEGYISIYINNGTEYDIVTTVYDGDGYGVEYEYLKAGENGTVYIEECTSDLVIDTIQYPDGKKFNVKVTNANPSNVTIKVYDQSWNNELNINSNFEWWDALNFELENSSNKDYIVKVIDYTKKIYEAEVLYAKSGSENSKAYLDYIYVHSDLELVVEEKGNNNIVKFGYSCFGHYGDKATITDANGNELKLSNRTLIVESGTNIIIYYSSPSSILTIYIENSKTGDNVKSPIKLKEGGSTIINLTVNCDILINVNNV